MALSSRQPRRHRGAKEIVELNEESKHAEKRSSVLVPIGLLGSLVLLIVHALHYEFLLDDAFISFRYARNLADGFGLVFNPGFERVEGYTNFLWVVLLAGARSLGFGIEKSAVVLSIGFTVALWATVVRFAWKRTPAEKRAWVLVPGLLLAGTRSVAVWSTSGLETRLFELLVVAGVLRLIDELEASGKPRPLGAALLALATLTRPDGLLVAGSLFAAALLLRGGRFGDRAPWALGSAAIYAAVVGGHFVFRYVYYGAWLPNTFYAKVGGEAWWGMGGAYFTAFALEYGMVLWVPFLVAAVAHHRRSATPAIPVLFGAATIPHAVYLAALGGDHFEYRPADLYFSFAYLLIGVGAMSLARNKRSSVLVLTGLAFVAAGIVELPYRSHVQFPSTYFEGFPGCPTPEKADEPGVAEATGFLSPRKTLLYRLPGVQAIARKHRDLVRTLTEHFVAIRQEEHVLFADTAVREGRELARLVDTGVLPRNTHVAIDCVGAIPYHSELRTLDRLGLTDAVVARGDDVRQVMAHTKHAGVGYARDMGVDLWAVHPVHLLWDVNDSKFVREVTRLALQDYDAHFAEIGGGRILLAHLLQGVERARDRFPTLRFRSVLDREALSEIAELARTLHGRDPVVQTNVAMALFKVGEYDRAIPHFRSAVAADPRDSASRNNLASALAQRGELDEAVELLAEAIQIAPDDPDLHANFGRIRLLRNEPELAKRHFERALALDPENAKARAGISLMSRAE